MGSILVSSLFHNPYKLERHSIYSEGVLLYNTLPPTCVYRSLTLSGTLSEGEFLKIAYSIRHIL